MWPYHEAIEHLGLSCKGLCSLEGSTESSAGSQGLDRLREIPGMVETNVKKWTQEDEGNADCIVLGYFPKDVQEYLRYCIHNTSFMHKIHHVE